MDRDFEGAVVLVTGGGAGIGRAAAGLFARRGAKVAVADVSMESGEEAVETIRARGDDAHFVHSDVADPASCEMLVQEVVTRYGRLDFAHNNAARSPQPYLASEVPPEEWEADFHANVLSVAMSMKFEIRQLLEQGGGGAIVNMSSAAATKVVPTRSHYSGGKAAVLAMTRTAAAENAVHGIRVNAILPGPVLTANLRHGFTSTPGLEQKVMASVPLGRVGDPDDLARAVVWLCSGDAAWVTGIGLPVDGGQHLSIV